MKAVVVEETGNDPVVKDVPEPEAGAGLEIAQVSMAALNAVDHHFASGRYAEAPVPHTVGREAVVVLGDGRRRYFYAPPVPGGSMAERIAVDPDLTFEIPDSFEDGQALVIGGVAYAAWLTLVSQAELSEGEDVLVLGASGALGQLAMQIARRLGAGRIVGAARNVGAISGRSAEVADALVEIGAVEDLAGGLKEAGGDFDVVIDPVGGDLLNQAILATAPGARLVNVGNNAGRLAEIDLRALQGRRLIGHSARFFGMDMKRRAYAELTQFMLDGDLDIPYQVFPLERFEEAWRLQGEGPHGKIFVSFQG